MEIEKSSAMLDSFFFLLPQKEKCLAGLKYQAFEYKFNKHVPLKKNVIDYIQN